MGLWGEPASGALALTLAVIHLGKALSALVPLGLSAGWQVPRRRGAAPWRDRRLADAFFFSNPRPGDSKNRLTIIPPTLRSLSQ